MDRDAGCKTVSFKEIREPLDKAINDLLPYLDSNRKNNLLFTIFYGNVLTSYETYKSVVKLASGEKRYGFQGRILSRSILDSFFSILFILDDHGERSIWYDKVHYRKRKEEYDKEKSYHGNDPTYKDYLKLLEKDLLLTEKSLPQLTSNEKQNIKKIPFWPPPSKMIRKIKDDNARMFFSRVYGDQYGELSEWIHMSMSGIFLGMGSAKDINGLSDKFESDAVFCCILFLLMLSSEIVKFCNIEAKRECRDVWEILSGHFGVAEGYYRERYRELLNGPAE